MKSRSTKASVFIGLLAFVVLSAGGGWWAYKNVPTMSVKKYEKEIPKHLAKSLADATWDNGQPMGSLPTYSEGLRDGVHMAATAENLELADWVIVTAEDIRYWDRTQGGGLPTDTESTDTWGTARAVGVNYTTERQEGASTGPAQLAKYMLNQEEGRDRKEDDSYFAAHREWQKLRENALGDIAVRRGGTKAGANAVLLGLANHVYMGGGVYGLKAAEIRYCSQFPDGPVNKVTGRPYPNVKKAVCAAFLGTIFPGLGKYFQDGQWKEEVVYKKRDGLIDLLGERGKITVEEAAQAKAIRVLPKVIPPDHNVEAPRTALAMLRNEMLSAGAKPEQLEMFDLNTEFNKAAQAKLHELISEQSVVVLGGKDSEGKQHAALLRVPEGLTLESAGLVMKLNGKVIAYSGRPNYVPGVSEFDYGAEKIAVGSTHKIFLYALALSNGWNPDDLLPNIALPGKYQPGSHFRLDGNNYTLRRYFEVSDNRAAVRLLAALHKPKGWKNGMDPMAMVPGYQQLKNVEEYAALLQRMGFRVPPESGLALGLGIAEADLYTLGRAVASVIYGGGEFRPLVPWRDASCRLSGCGFGESQLKAFQFCTKQAASEVESMMAGVFEHPGGTAYKGDDSELDDEGKTGSARTAGYMVHRVDDYLAIARTGYWFTTETATANAECFQKRKGCGNKKACNAICKPRKLPDFPLFGGQTALLVTRGFFSWLKTEHPVIMNVPPGETLLAKADTPKARPLGVTAEKPKASNPVKKTGGNVKTASKSKGGLGLPHEIVSVDKSGTPQ